MDQNGHYRWKSIKNLYFFIETSIGLISPKFRIEIDDFNISNAWNEVFSSVFERKFRFFEAACKHQYDRYYI
jgi:hypothetical protein